MLSALLVNYFFFSNLFDLFYLILFYELLLVPRGGEGRFELVTSAWWGVISHQLCYPFGLNSFAFFLSVLGEIHALPHAFLSIILAKLGISGEYWWFRRVWGHPSSSSTSCGAGYWGSNLISPPFLFTYTHTHTHMYMLVIGKWYFQKCSGCFYSSCMHLSETSLGKVVPFRNKEFIFFNMIKCFDFLKHRSDKTTLPIKLPLTSARVFN